MPSASSATGLNPRGTHRAPARSAISRRAARGWVRHGQRRVPLREQVGQHPGTCLSACTLECWRSSCCLPSTAATTRPRVRRSGRGSADSPPGPTTSTGASLTSRDSSSEVARHIGQMPYFRSNSRLSRLRYRRTTVNRSTGHAATTTPETAGPRLCGVHMPSASTSDEGVNQERVYRIWSMTQAAELRTLTLEARTDPDRVRTTAGGRHGPRCCRAGCRFCGAVPSCPW